MKKILPLLIFTAGALCLFPVILLAQISGTTYKISTGSIVGGGGVSASSNYSLVGIAPLVGSVSLSSASYMMTTGPTAISYGSMTTLRAVYDGNNITTVNKTTQTLSVTYSGSSGDASGTIYYRQGGATSYQTAAMTSGSGETLIYTFPANLLTIRGLEYYFQIARGTYISIIGSASSPLIFRVNHTNAQAQNPIATEVKKYRIVGVPLTITGSNSVAAVFEDDLGVYNTSQWRIGRYNTGSHVVDEFSVAPNVVPGNGYWLITAEPQTFGAAGVTVRPNRVANGADYFAVPLDNGWNQLANPFGFRIAWDEILYDAGGTIYTHPVPASVIEDAAYSYNGTGYETYNAIPPWEGVFVRCNQDNVTALMPYKATTMAPKLAPLKDQPVYSDFFWNIEVQLLTDKFTDYDNFIGVRPDAEEGPDNYDFSEPPPAPD